MTPFRCLPADRETLETRCCDILSAPRTRFESRTRTHSLVLVVKSKGLYLISQWHHIDPANNQWLFSIHSLITLTQPYLTDGSWRHLTVTWCNSVEWTLSLDGQLLGSTTEDTWSSFSNIPVGTLLIGQNQHPINFPIPGSFQGQITAFNVWNHKMDDSEIAMLAQSCVNIPGNVFRWSTFKNNVHGALKLVKPSTCE